MKEIFFKGVAVALPLFVLGGLIYLVFNGFYQLYADMQLKRELDQIRRESEIRRQRRKESESATDQVSSSEQGPPPSMP
jgi:hypothetical protein